MSADYSKLKNFVDESKGSSGNASTSSSFHSAKDLMSGFFTKNPFGTNFSAPSRPGNQSIDDQTESWFRESENDPYCPKLNKKQRILGFMILLVMGMFCMGLASLYIPVIVFKSRKFVLLFSLGSVFFISSFALLWGVKKHLKHLLDPARLPFTLCYFSTLFATIYYAMIVKSVLFTLLFAVLQILSLVWYIVSYIPGGQTGLKFFTQLFYSFISKAAQTLTV